MNARSPIFLDDEAAAQDCRRSGLEDLGCNDCSIEPQAVTSGAQRRRMPLRLRVRLLRLTGVERFS